MWSGAKDTLGHHGVLWCFMVVLMVTMESGHIPFKPQRTCYISMLNSMNPSDYQKLQVSQSTSSISKDFLTGNKLSKMQTSESLLLSKFATSASKDPVAWRVCQSVCCWEPPTGEQRWSLFRTFIGIEKKTYITFLNFTSEGDGKLKMRLSICVCRAPLY